MEQGNTSYTPEGVRLEIRSASGDGAPHVTDESTKQRDRIVMPDGASRETLRAIAYWYRWKWRYNIRSEQVEWKNDRARWAPYEDRKEKAIIEEIRQHYAKPGKNPQPLQYSRERLDICAAALAEEHEEDPFLERIEALPEWDGLERLQHLFKIVFNTPPDPLSLWAGMAIIIGPIQRAYDPGCRLDEMMVLSGPQGVGKGSLMEQLIWPDMRSEWLRKSWRFQPENIQRSIQSTIGPVYVEYSELSGIKRNDLEPFKAYLTDPFDWVRLPYAKRDTKHMRRFYMVGSSDDEQPLPFDAAGNRRFVVIPCPERMADAHPYIDEQREQLWAEGKHKYLAENCSAALPDAMQAFQRTRNEAMREQGAYEEAIAVSLDNGEILAGVGYTLDTLAQNIGAVFAHALPDRIQKRELARSLKKCGFVSKALRPDTATLCPEVSHGKSVRRWILEA